MHFPGSGNPVYQMTLRQVQARPRRRGWRWWVSNAVYLTMLAPALIVYFGQWAGLLLWRDAYPIARDLSGVLFLLTLYAIFTHIGILLRILLMAANLISHMRTTGSWDLLVLTGIPARQIISGMWWAIVRATLRGWLYLLPLRVGATVYTGVSLSYPFVTYYSSYGPTPNVRNLDVSLVPPSPLALLLIVPLSFAFSVIAGAVVAAIGLLASALVRRVSGAGVVAFVLMFALLGGSVLLAAIGYRVGQVLFPPDNFAITPVYTDFTRINNGVALAWFDNGGSLLSSLIVYSTTPGPVDAATLWALIRRGTWQTFSLWTLLLTPAIFAVLVALLTATLLRLARGAAIRAGALP